MKTFSESRDVGLISSMNERVARLNFCRLRNRVPRGQKRCVNSSAARLTIGAVLLICATSGCTIRQQSVIPKTIVSTQASFSGNVQNSGLIGPDGKGGFIVDAHFIQRWDALTAKYGSRFTPPIKAGDRRGIEERVDSFSVTAEIMANFRQMVFWKRSEAGP